MKSGNRKSYSFKSVGNLEKDERDVRKKIRIERVVPIGIKTPIEFTYSRGSLFKMHEDLGNQIADNFKNMVMTNHGERVGHYDFGANLSELAFELGTEDIDSVAMRRIARTTEKYMPYIQLDSFEPFVDRKNNEHTAKIGIRITYSIPTLAVAKKAIDVIIHVSS